MLFPVPLNLIVSLEDLPTTGKATKEFSGGLVSFLVFTQVARLRKPNAADLALEWLTVEVHGAFVHSQLTGLRCSVVAAWPVTNASLRSIMRLHMLSKSLCRCILLPTDVAGLGLVAGVFLEMAFQF